MGNEPPKIANRESLDQDIPVDRGRTLQMVRGDYEFPWKGVLRESIQNAADAWARNKNEGVIPSDQNLELYFEIDTSDRVFIYRDNAGGMSKDILEYNLVGIDTPDDEKEEGGGAGAYGRGFHVVSSVGTGRTYVETKHQTDHLSVTLNKEGKYSPPEEPNNPQLDEKGTYIFVDDVIKEDIDGKLNDWGAVEEVLLENFNFLFLREDVDLRYEVDGECFEPNPVDLYKYKEEGEITVETSLEEFTFRGETYELKDFVVVRADAVDWEPPWEGVALLKGNTHLEHPFMTVQIYKPRNISSLNKPAQMFGWCDADDLCPELENNAHTQFNSRALSNSSLKSVLRDIHNEYFRKEQSTKEREELRSDIRSNINELLVSFDDFDDYQILSDDIEADTGGSGRGEYDSGGGSGHSIVCSAGSRDFDTGDNVPLEIALENPQDSDIKRYRIFDIKVTSDALDEDITFGDTTVSVEPDETKFHNLTGFVPDKEGRYVFKAKSEPVDGEGGVEQSNIYVRVGDVEPRSSGGSKEEQTGGGEGEGGGHQQVAIVENVRHSPDAEDSYKAALELGDHGGFNVLINTDRPEWEAAEELEDDERRKTIQERLGTQWGAEQIIFNRQLDDLDEIAESHDLGDDVTSEIETMLEDKDDMRSKIEYLVSSEQGVGYE